MPLPAKDYEDRYTSAQVCAAVGISESTLKNWVSRKPQVVLMTSEERERAGRGVPLLFSFQRVMQIAITAELVALGLQPRPAALAAAAFTDTDTGADDGGWVYDAPSAPLRQPGQLFPVGITYLVVPNAADDDAINADVKNVMPDTTVYDLLRGERIGRPGAVSAILLDVNAVHDRIRGVLGA